MALWATFKVNSKSIGAVNIQRIEPGGTPGPNVVCRYSWEVLDGNGMLTGEVEHRYGDGAIHLLHAVLAAAIETAATSPELER